MSNKKTYIELNGIRYDAHTGQVLEGGDEVSAKNPEPVVAVAVPVTGGKVVDGFTRRTARASLAPAHNSKKLHTPPQKSKTLMRPAVRKPEIAKQPVHAKAKAVKNHPKPIVSPDHAERVERAHTAKKSNIISRFYKGSGSSELIKRIEPIPVVATPKAHSHASQTLAASEAAHPASQIGKRFEHAIEEATSHLNTHHIKRKRPKRITVISSTLVVVLLAGFFTYQNVPNVQMKVAASRAGFSAGLPGYSPAGFGVAGPIKAEPGKVTVTFKSRTDDKAFQVKQQVSEWSPTALLTHYASDKSELRTYPDERGRTLYIYGDANVTWVDSGVWYDVQGNASLSDDQLLRIANSL